MRYYFVSAMYQGGIAGFSILNSCISMEKFVYRDILKTIEKYLTENHIQFVGGVSIISLMEITKEEYNENKSIGNKNKVKGL